MIAIVDQVSKGGRTNYRLSVPADYGTKLYVMTPETFTG